MGVSTAARLSSSFHGPTYWGAGGGEPQSTKQANIQSTTASQHPNVTPTKLVASNQGMQARGVAVDWLHLLLGEAVQGSEAPRYRVTRSGKGAFFLFEWFQRG